MKKAVIVTFHCVPNYGAVLQAYALQQTLLKIADSVEILNYVPPNLMLNYHYFYFDSFKLLISCLINLPMKLIRYGRFRRFLKKNMTLTECRFHANAEVNVGSDYVILGSDQIWNFDITGADITYFGYFNKNANCRVISYAASLGKDTLGQQELSAYSRLLKNIDLVSVRENSAKTILSHVYPNPISVSLDPTLLLSKEEWLKVSKKCPLHNYLLVYSLNGYEETYSVAEKIAKEKGLKLYEIISGSISFLHRRNRTVLPFSGPAEFLGLIIDADYVVTDSFHGTAFSVIFNKNFYTIPHRTKGARMIELLKMLKLEGRIVNSNNARMTTADVDFDIPNTILKAEREKSLSYLEVAVKEH